MLLFFDPGKHWGLSCFTSAGDLFFAAEGEGPKALRETVIALKDYPIESLCIERPQLYEGKESKFDSLLSCYRYAGILFGLLLMDHPGISLKEIRPQAWKGSVPKPMHHARNKRALRPEEIPLFDRLGPDGKDSICLGLFEVGRVKKGGVLCSM